MLDTKSIRYSLRRFLGRRLCTPCFQLVLHNILPAFANVWNCQSRKIYHKKMFKLAVVLVLTFVGLAASQFVESGSCSNVTLQPNFDVPSYMGLWYEHAKYATVFQSTGARCTTAQYTFDTCTSSVIVLNTQVLQNGTVDSLIGNAVVESNAKLVVNFPTTDGAIATTSNYWVLGTDYTSYSVVFYCSQLPLNRRATVAWILTRQAVPSAATVQTAKNILTQNGISLTPLIYTNQVDCAPRM